MPPVCYVPYHPTALTQNGGARRRSQADGRQNTAYLQINTYSDYKIHITQLECCNAVDNLTVARQ